MSTGAECRFQEVEPGVWKYELQLWPYGDNDQYEVYGGFSSYSKALEHLHENHANPGGHSVHPLEDDRHRHEWETTEQQVKVGVEVAIKVISLGPDPDKDALFAKVAELAASQHEAWRTWAVYGTGPPVIACESCGQLRDSRPVGSEGSR